MGRKNRTPEEKARREKIRELLQMANISSMDDIQNLFKETIAEFMENGLEAELEDELGYSRYDYRNKATDNSRNGHSSKTLRTSFADVEVSVPRDRKGEFEPLRYALPQDLVEDLFGNVVIPETPATVLADRRRVRRLVCQVQPAEPLVGDVVVDLFLQPCLGLDPVQVPHQQHPEQYLRVDGGPAVVRAIQRRTQIVDEAEVHRTVYFPQKVILRHHLFHDHQFHLLLLLPPLLEHSLHRLVFFLVVLMYLYST